MEGRVLTLVEGEDSESKGRGQFKEQFGIG